MCVSMESAFHLSLYDCDRSQNGSCDNEDEEYDRPVDGRYFRGAEQNTDLWIKFSDAIQQMLMASRIEEKSG